MVTIEYLPKNYNSVRSNNLSLKYWSWGTSWSCTPTGYKNIGITHFYILAKTELFYFKEVCLEENYTTSLFTRFPKKQYIVEMHYSMTGIGA